MAVLLEFTPLCQGDGVAHVSIDPKTQARLDWLAVNGICTSITYGPSEGRGIIWTVNCLSPIYLDFERPERAHSFDHAVEIAVIHSIKLGFVEGPPP
jgi:hypothetical protein